MQPWAAKDINMTQGAADQHLLPTLTVCCCASALPDTKQGVNLKRLPTPLAHGMLVPATALRSQQVQ